MRICCLDRHALKINPLHIAEILLLPARKENVNNSLLIVNGDLCMCRFLFKDSRP